MNHISQEDFKIVNCLPIDERVHQNLNITVLLDSMKKKLVYICSNMIYSYYYIYCYYYYYLCCSLFLCYFHIAIAVVVTNIILIINFMQ